MNLKKPIGYSIVIVREMSKMKFHVIDQNYLRDNDLKKRIISSDPEEYFVVTDTALIEMMKYSKWQKISRNSLQIISEHPNKILVSESIPDLIREELSTKKTIGLFDLFSDNLTKAFRQYLLEFQRQGQSGALHFDIAEAIKTERALLDRQQLNHSQNLCKLQKGCKELKNILDEESLKRARNNKLTHDELREIIAKPVVVLTASFLKENGFSKNEIYSFLLNNPFTFRFQVAFTMLCLRWISSGGVESLKADKSTNEFMDMEYVLIASYGNSILSREPEVHKQLEDLHTICSILNLNSI